MSPEFATFAGTVASFRPSEDSIRTQAGLIYRDALALVGRPDFTSIRSDMLEFLFDAYDERFFSGLMRPALDGPVSFRFAPRLTKAGGKTSRLRHPDGSVSYGIAIAIRMLFDGFRDTDRRVTVCGLECRDRLEALQRIFEHEIVHLAEQICHGESNCSAARFQEIAGRLFLHRAHTHALITRRERAAQAGIGVGSQVAFDFEGRELSGRVNRITQRVTVLVEDPGGQRYSDGGCYKTYYVPLRGLRPKER